MDPSETTASAVNPDRILALGGTRQLLVDDYLIDTLVGGELRLHQPTPREVVLQTDRPWEGNMNTFNTLMKVDGEWRLYYRGWLLDVESRDSNAPMHKLVDLHVPTICMATSSDGRTWTRPDLGVYEWEGSRANNIILQGPGWHGFSPFEDANPACEPDARFKAIGVNDYQKPASLFTFASPDGIHWRPYLEAPILEGVSQFDSHNLVFWDAQIGQYRAYCRVNHRSPGKWVRGIFTITSPDFREWSAPQDLDFGDAPEEQLYTNNVQPYYRAPELYVGLPARYVERVPWTPSMDQLPELAHRKARSALHERYGTALSDAVLMTSRDGVHFKRWSEAFIRPGQRSVGSWTYGDIYPAWGMIETVSDFPGGEPELSLYASEGYWRGSGSSVRRYSLRVDGFVSLHAPYAGARMESKPFTFTGARLSLNVSTSAAGSGRVGLVAADGSAIPGYGLDDCWDIIGDTLDYTVTWRETADVSALAGRAVRLQIELRDADLYSLVFC